MSQKLIGRKTVYEALESGLSLDHILLADNVKGEWEKKFRNLSRKQGVPLKRLPVSVLDKQSKGNHQGVIAFTPPVPYYRVEQVIPSIYEKGEIPLLLVLDGVSDIRNFGAIARSAEAFGAHAIVIPAKGGASINETSIKTSAGALLRIPVCREPSLVNALGYLRESGIFLAGAESVAEETVESVDWTVPCAVVLGSEGEGISPAVGRELDRFFAIPQKGETESLNVSVSAGIILYEMNRQRWKEL